LGFPFPLGCPFPLGFPFGLPFALLEGKQKGFSFVFDFGFGFGFGFAVCVSVAIRFGKGNDREHASFVSYERVSGKVTWGVGGFRGAILGIGVEMDFCKTLLFVFSTLLQDKFTWRGSFEFGRGLDLGLHLPLIPYERVLGDCCALAGGLRFGGRGGGDDLGEDVRGGNKLLLIVLEEEQGLPFLLPGLLFGGGGGEDLGDGVGRGGVKLSVTDEPP